MKYSTCASLSEVRETDRTFQTSGTFKLGLEFDARRSQNGRWLNGELDALMAFARGREVHLQPFERHGGLPLATISVREFDMPQEFEIPDFLHQYWHWLSGIFF